MLGKIIPTLFLWKRLNFSSDEYLSLCFSALSLVLETLHIKCEV